MARKSKIELEWDTDWCGRNVLRVTRKTGKLTWAEVMEKLTDDGGFDGRYFVQELYITGDLPLDLYDEGDVWNLYELDDYLGADYVERLRPKKPILTAQSGAKKIGTCPTCGGDVKRTGVNDRYCSCCGQELDWSVE